MDSVDLSAAQKLGIKVTNTPDAPTLPVAELTLAHMLNLLRHISHTDRSIRLGIWEPQMGTLLNGKKVGIIGYGRIGKKVASLVEAFSARVLVYDTLPQTALSENVQQVTFDHLLSESDIVTLHLPYTYENHNLISEQQLKMMKKTALLLNISRGGLVNEIDLVDALKKQEIAGAGIDAFEKEPYTGSLKDFPNVLLTAHMGSYAKEARFIMEQQAASNLFENLNELKFIV